MKKCTWALGGAAEGRKTGCVSRSVVVTGPDLGITRGSWVWRREGSVKIINLPWIPWQTCFQGLTLGVDSWEKGLWMKMKTIGEDLCGALRMKAERKGRLQHAVCAHMGMNLLDLICSRTQKVKIVCLVHFPRWYHCWSQNSWRQYLIYLVTHFCYLYIF